jgi:hypothetical protein
MVGYDDDNNALTLGDDDSIAVGDYSLRYSSANDRFEVEHPNGEISDVPRSTSGSLVPQGLAESVAAGEALADDGNTYSSVQDAVNAASGFVFVGPGTFNESVTISTEGLTLEGSGHDTLIDGGTTGNAVDIQASDVTVRSLSVQTTAGAGNNFSGVTTTNATPNNVTVEFVTVRDSDRSGIFVQSGADNTVRGCTVNSTDTAGITNGERSIVTDCTIKNTGSAGIETFRDDAIVSNNIIDGASGRGIRCGATNDLLIGGNRVINSGDNGIRIAGADCIVYNNRVSDSTNTDISDAGTGTVLDGNLTGLSN